MNGGHDDKNRKGGNDSWNGRTTRMAWLSNTVDVFKAVLQAMDTAPPSCCNGLILCQRDIKEECLYTVGRYKLTYSHSSQYQ